MFTASAHKIWTARLQYSVLLALLVFLLGVIPARAATITVSGGCTLPDAIVAANSDSNSHNSSCTAGSGADTISLTASITLSGTLPDISSDITLDGNNWGIGIAVADRIIYITSGTVTINDMSIGGGQRSTIFNAGALTINRSSFYGNSGTQGGAIENRGTLYIYQSAFFNNLSVTSGGAIGSNGTLTVVNSTFARNYSDNGAGAISASGNGDRTIINSTFVDNLSRSGFDTLAIGNYRLFNSIITGLDET